MPRVHRTKIFLTTNVIDRQTHTKHNIIAKGFIQICTKQNRKKDQQEQPHNKKIMKIKFQLK